MLQSFKAWTDEYIKAFKAWTDEYLRSNYGDLELRIEGKKEKVCIILLFDKTCYL